MSRKRKKKNPLSHYVTDILSATEQEAWAIACEMINDENIRRMLLSMYQRNIDSGFAFPDTLHDLLLYLMNNDRRALRSIKRRDSFGQWLKICYKNALWHSNKRYLTSIQAFGKSLETILMQRKYEVDDRTWVLCIMLVKMEKILDNDWLFMFYRMLLRQFKTTGYEIHANKIAAALGITHQRYRDRITTIRVRTRKVLSDTKLSDLNWLTLQEQNNVVEYVTAIEKHETLEYILLERYHEIVECLPCAIAVKSLALSYPCPTEMYNYVFKRLPYHYDVYEPLHNSAEEEIIDDYALYEVDCIPDNRANVTTQQLYEKLHDIARKEMIIDKCYGIFY